MKRKLRAGILGFGGIAHVHADGYADQKDCELVAIADTAPEQLKKADAELNLGKTGTIDLGKLRKYHSFEEMVEAEELDFIDICTPTYCHAKYAVSALKRGLNVLCEKPMARNIREVDAMIGAARESGRQLMIAQCLRFMPCYEELKRIYADRRFGKLLRLALHRDCHLPTGYKNWFRDGSLSGGAVLDMHIHDLDFINYLLGAPDAIASYGCGHHTGEIDNAETHFIYRNGPVASAETSWSRAKFSMGYVAVFEKATVAMDRVDEIVIERLDKEPEKIAVTPLSGYQREIAYFAECLRKGVSPERCSLESTRDTMRVAFAAARSAACGGRRIAIGKSR